MVQSLASSSQAADRAASAATKALLAAKTLIAWASERLKPAVDALVLNANGDPARFGNLALPVITDDPSPGIGDFAGPLSGLPVEVRSNATDERPPVCAGIRRPARSRDR